MTCGKKLPANQINGKVFIFSSCCTFMPNEWEEQEFKDLLEKYTAVTIPVKVSIEAQQHVLDMGSVKKILQGSELISLEECYCRKNLGNCDKPLEVCLSLNKSAAHAIEERGARKISLKEALNVLEESHRAGLVHLAYHQKGEKTEVICSCCSCCCHHVIALRQFGYHETLMKSQVVANFEESLCVDCGLCVERCQFGAWSRDNGGVKLDSENCFGCGLCVSSCSAGAISLVER